MKFRSVSGEELEKIRNLDGAAGVIRRKAKVLIENLAKEFNDSDPGGVGGVHFSYSDSPRVIGKVNSKFGAGRLRLTWKHDGNQLLGEVVVDREIFNQQDQQCWEPAFSFLLAEQGRWMPSNKTEEPPYYLNGDTATRDWALGASIFYAILHGPVVTA